MSLSIHMVIAIFIVVSVILLILLVKIVQRCRDKHRHVDITASLSSAGYVEAMENREKGTWNVSVENMDVERSNGNPCIGTENELNHSKTVKTSHDI